MRKLVLYVLLLLGPNLFAEDPNYFGEVTLSTNGSVGELMTIRQALLYRNVSLSYDSTIFIQADDQMSVLFYPQLNSGNQNILRLVFGTSGENSTDNYDFYINFGDSIPKMLNFANAEGLVFIEENGLATEKQYITRDLSGTIQIIRGRKKEAVSGSLNLSFNKFSSLEDNLVSSYKINGEFDVPVGKYRESSLSTTAFQKEQSKRYRHNTLIAVGIIAFLFAVFGFR